MHPARRFQSGLLAASLLVACGAGPGGSGTPNDALVAATPPELAKDILSRYGYSVEEFWQIVDRTRDPGNQAPTSSSSEVRRLTENCTFGYADSDTMEKMDIVIAVPDACKIEFLFQRDKSGTAADRTITAKLWMKLKDPADNQFFGFQSLDCDGSANGSEASSTSVVNFTQHCKVVDNFYGEFDASFEGRIDVAPDKVTTSMKALIVTPGHPEKSMQGGAARVLYNVGSASGATSFEFNGQASQAIESPGWFPGLRVN